MTGAPRSAGHAFTVGRDPKTAMAGRAGHRESGATIGTAVWALNLPEPREEIGPVRNPSLRQVWRHQSFSR